MTHPPHVIRLRRRASYCKILRSLGQLGLPIVSLPHLYPAPNPIIRAALLAGVPVDNDIGLFFRSFAGQDWVDFDTSPKVVAVTGSNGKSTTSALIHHILAAAGRPTQLAGNIGRGVFDLDPAQDGDVIVLELSSYQTELARALTPDIAVWTNISPDHLDRHAGLVDMWLPNAVFLPRWPDRAVVVSMRLKVFSLQINVNRDL